MSTCRKVCTLLGATLFMLFCGTTYIIGTITPYIANYFRVEISEVQLILPSIILLQTCIMPIGGCLAQRMPARLLMAIGGIICVGSMLLATLVSRDSFMAFFILFVGGFGILEGLCYMVPIQLGWKTVSKRSGLISGIIIAGFGAGALIFC